MVPKGGFGDRHGGNVRDFSVGLGKMREVRVLVRVLGVLGFDV